MKALLSVKRGGPETLQLTELPMPSPGKGELLIQIRASGVNFPDTLMLYDMYQTKPPRPFAPGGEFSGEVIEVGEGVTNFAVGDRVLSLTNHGGFATNLVLKASDAIKFPITMSFEDAACFIFTYGTSHHALKDRAALKPGETLVVIGAAGGVGSAAVELGKAAGARVIAAVSSDEKAEFCREMGADEVIVYPREMDKDAQKAFSSQLKKMTGGKGIDVVLDAVGGDYAEPVIRAMAWRGRYLVVGFPAGIPNIPLNLVLLKGCQIVGVFWGAAVFQEPDGHDENVNDLFRLYGDGKIKPRISAKFPLERANEALVMMQNREVIGKIVITMGGED